MTAPLPPLHDDLLFNAPMSAQRPDALAAFVAQGSGHVLDVGCGWAELLLRTVALAPEAHGTGVDVDREALDHAQTLAAARGLSERVTFVEGEGAQVAQGPVDAVLSIGARHVWGPDDATALGRLRGVVRRGGRVVYGDGIWSRPPTPPAVEHLGGSPDEFGTLADVVDAAIAAGFRVLAVGEASQEEWDAFESGYSAGYERWLLDHPDDPGADDIRERAARHRSAYLRGYRGILGHCFLELVAA
jgi:SAM-dependent methyltransferase